MGCIALARYVLVLRCGLAGVVSACIRIMLVLPSSGACVLFVVLFHGLYSSGTICVGVTLWFGWGGVVFNPEHVSDVNTSILRSLRLIC
jgi:hypothetical protein